MSQSAIPPEDPLWLALLKLPFRFVKALIQQKGKIDE